MRTRHANGLHSVLRRFSLAFIITCNSLSANASPVSDWDIEKLSRVLAELSVAAGECEKTTNVDIGSLSQLFDILSEKAAIAEGSHDEKRQLKENVDSVTLEYKRAPASFCWAINEKYGARGTLLPGVTTAR